MIEALAAPSLYTQGTEGNRERLLLKVAMSCIMVRDEIVCEESVTKDLHKLRLNIDD
jgi:hypothetical protein